MRSSILFVFNIALLWLPLSAVAQQSSNDVAEAYARKIWNKLSDAERASVLKSTKCDIGDVSCHVVVRTDTTKGATLPGYMLIATESGTHILLAWDEQSQFSTAKLPPHVKYWIEGYKWACPSGNEEKRAVEAWLKSSRTAFDDVAPLLGNREWGQDNPYNLLCPSIDGKHCPSGCVATALSQIMCHYKWPETGEGRISYKTSSHKMTVSYDFNNTTFEWDKMLDTYFPFEDVSSQEDNVVKDKKYYLGSFTVDTNSVPLSKCYINVTSLTVMGASFFEGDVVLLLTDEEDNYVSRATSSISINTQNSGQIISNKSFLISIPATVPDGSYRLYCAARSDGTDAWSLSNSRSESGFIEIKKEKSLFTIGESTYPCSLSSEDVLPISTLLHAVGAAVRMDYDLDGSGSNNTNTLDGLLSYLRYDPDMFFAYPEMYTDEQWHAMLQKELVEGRPVYYTGQGLQSGHAFVIDGFKKADDGTTYYHVNWGWDGLCNGYYLLNMLRPSSTGTGGSSGSNYSNTPSMLIGLKPDDGVSQMRMSCSGIDLLAEEYRAGGFLPARIRSLSMNTSSSFEGSLQLELYNEDNSIAPIRLYDEGVSITSKRGLKDYYISAQIPTTVGSGDYVLKVVCTTGEGEDADIQCNEWPKISVKGADDWTGGPLTQPLQK